MMKIRHLSSFSDAGGATIAAKRFSTALVKAGYDSKFIGIVKNRGSLYARLLSFCDRFPLRLYRNRMSVPFSIGLVGTLSGLKSVMTPKTTVINLHWMNGGVFSLLFLALRRGTILWTLHDMWPLTGGCHYSFSCKRYVEGCGFCPLLGSKSRYDITFWMIRLKRIMLRNVIFIAPSKWMLSVANESFVQSFQHSVCVRNIHLDLKEFDENLEPCSKKSGTEPIQDTILFVADSLDDKLKGSEYLEPLIIKLIHNTAVNITIVGKLDETVRGKINEHRRVNYLGFVAPEKMQQVYSKVTCLVTLSIQENFSNVIVEAMYADLPVIGFNIGGNSDLIIHKETGYLVDTISIDDILDGVLWVMNKKGQLRNQPKRHINKLCDSKSNISNYIGIINGNY